ncbi:MAG: hypothetical protein LBB74_02305 [Chitinispirillales bacterium]|nr:hypothetical protein [Chitinispirillales bacterium]
MRNPNDPLDRHKCVSSFMIAFLENFQTKTEASIGLERVAISMGLHILKIFIREDCKDHNDMSLINLIERNGGFKFPKCECDDEPYIDNWALGLHYDRKRNRLSVLSLSNVLFLIEQHNRNLIY